DLAGHAEFGVGLAIAGLDVAAQVAGAAGRDRHQPLFGELSRIDLDLADRALEFRERHGLAVLLLRHLHLAREHHLRERMRGEVMRIAARVAQDQLVELAGFKLELLRREFVFAGRAEIDRYLDRRLLRQIARRQRGPRSYSNTTAAPSAKRKEAMFVSFEKSLAETMGSPLMQMRMTCN